MAASLSFAPLLICKHTPPTTLSIKHKDFVFFIIIFAIFILQADGYQGDFLPNYFLLLLSLLMLLLLLLTDLFAWHTAATSSSQLLAAFNTITPGFLECNVLIPSIDSHSGSNFRKNPKSLHFYFILFLFILEDAVMADCKGNVLFQKEQQAMMILKFQLATW